MRKPFIAGNWKMNKSVTEAKELVSSLQKKVKDVENVEIGVCPTALALSEVKNLLADTNIKVGAQNIYWEDSGAFTGEISAEMLADINIDYIIIGHSERRQYFNESDQDVNRKVKSALAHQIKPIICVGETLTERKSQETENKVRFQVKADLAGLTADEVKKVVIAYEPIWAIGTGESATAEEANRVIGIIRDVVRDEYPQVADKVRIQYGGSVKPHNCIEIMKQPEIDGALVGGASLDAASFAEIVLKTTELY